ncbi:MAG: hypothetical protein GF329_03275 [Candidatus Lokiarchaeota archaeon]|nr:hypothetical protein [Candidatus Lokiarchaeota archaeon]
MGRIFINEVNRELNRKIWNVYKKADFVGTFNPKFIDSKAEKILVKEYKNVLNQLIETKSFKKVIIKHNDLNIMNKYHPSVLSLDLRPFLKAVDTLGILKQYLFIKAGSIVPYSHNKKLLGLEKILSDMNWNLLDGNNLKLRRYKTGNKYIPILYIPEIFDKDTLFIAFNDAKTNSFSGATISMKVSAVGTTGFRLKYHSTYKTDDDEAENIFGKWLTLYCQALPIICGQVVSIINYKYKKQGTTCTYFESKPIENPFILSGDDIIPIDYAGELIMFGKAYSKALQAYKNFYDKLPEIAINAKPAKDKLLEIHSWLKYPEPDFDFPELESWFPGLAVDQDKECRDGCSGMCLFSIMTHAKIGDLPVPRQCGNKIRIVTGKVLTPREKYADEFLVAYGSCACKMCKDADLKFEGCPVSPALAIMIPFTIPGFPNLKDFRTAYLQYASQMKSNIYYIFPVIEQLFKNVLKNPIAVIEGLKNIRHVKLIDF